MPPAISVPKHVFNSLLLDRCESVGATCPGPAEHGHNPGAQAAPPAIPRPKGADNRRFYGH